MFKELENYLKTLSRLVNRNSNEIADLRLEVRSPMPMYNTFYGNIKYIPNEDLEDLIDLGILQAKEADC